MNKLFVNEEKEKPNELQEQATRIFMNDPDLLYVLELFSRDSMNDRKFLKECRKLRKLSELRALRKLHLTT